MTAPLSHPVPEKGTGSGAQTPDWVARVPGERHGDQVLYRVPAVLALSLLTCRQIDYWCTSGRIKPVVEADGSGSRRLFSVEQVQQLRYARDLMIIGFRPGEALDLGGKLAAYGSAELSLCCIRLQVGAA